jgi:hypothetical protein
MGLGLGRALPADYTSEQVLEYLCKFVALGFIPVFYEVVEGDLYQIRLNNGETQVTLVKEDPPLPDWNPNEWVGDYTYVDWYKAMLEAWNSRPGGDITYNEWSKIELSIFVPFYEGPTKWVKVDPKFDSLGVCSVESAYWFAEEIDLPSYFRRTLDVAAEFLFLVRISG